MDTPKPGWSLYRSEGCQFKVVYPGRGDPGRPINKACLWIANFDLSGTELRCRQPAALMATSHDHRHARGQMYVEGEGSQSVAGYTGRYTPQQGAVYAKACKAVCDAVVRRRPNISSKLTRLANQLQMASPDKAKLPRRRKT